jgi:hypothetical protein
MSFNPTFFIEPFFVCNIIDFMSIFSFFIFSDFFGCFKYNILKLTYTLIYAFFIVGVIIVKKSVELALDSGVASEI